MKKVLHLQLILLLIFSFNKIINAKSFEDSNAAYRETYLQNRNTINGFVFGSSRTPLSDIYVELSNDLGSTITRTKTSSSGLYNFRNLPNGIFIVRILPYSNDYETQERRVNLISVSSVPGRGSVSEQVDFYLNPKKVNRGPLAAPGVIFAQDIPKDAKKFYEQGIDYLEDKKEIEGFESLKKAIEIFPTYYLALDRLGTEYVVRGYYRPAYVILSKSVEVNPKSFSSIFGLGLALYNLNELKQAEENLRNAIKIYADSPNVYLWLGIVLLKNKNLSEAETALLQANKLSKGRLADAHFQLARLYGEQNKYKEAATELELFLKYNPDAKDSEKIKQAIAKLREKEMNKSAN